MNYDNIARLMCWDLSDRTAPVAFQQECGDLSCMPPDDIVEVAVCGSLEEYAKTILENDRQRIFDKVLDVCNRIIVCDVFNDRKKRGTFPPLYNLFVYVSGLQQRGRLIATVDQLVTEVFNTYTAPLITKRHLLELFRQEPQEDLYRQAAGRMRDVWRFSERDIEALRYFVCQCKGMNRNNPSLNKELYLWGERKKTGKTTFARSLACILNGDTLDNAGRYNSTIAKECQYNEHDLPLACLYNCIVLDEAMPKDTKKTYGTIKAMLTSESVSYNPKFKQVINVQANRNYIFTSNDNINEYVQDESERRFYAIRFDETPEQLAPVEIVDILTAFVRNCTVPDDKSVSVWYDEIGGVFGRMYKEKEDIKTELINNNGYFQGYKTTSWAVARMFFKQEPNREQRKSVDLAMRELFEDCTYTSNRSIFVCQKIRERIDAIRAEQDRREYGGYESADAPF